MSTAILQLSKSLNLPCSDARKPMAIELLKEDIGKARQLDHHSCAFAMACTRSVKGATGAYFFRTTGWLQFKDKLVRYRLPPSMQREIIVFDRLGTMAPGVYVMSPPRGNDRISKIRERSKKRPGRHKPTGKGPKRKFRHYTTMVRGQGLAENQEKSPG